jgi:hypothetical protein
VKALARFEALIERLVDSSLVGLMGARLEPVEIAKRLSRAMESERIIGPAGPIAPNGFIVRLGSKDYASYEPVREALEQELASYLLSAARERRLQLLAAPVVRVELDPTLRRHQLAVIGRLAEAPPPPEGSIRTERFAAVAPSPPAERPGKRLPTVSLASTGTSAVTMARIDRSPFTIGRALDNQFVLDDSRVSRYHATILVEDAACKVRDMDSTNGTWVNGIRIREKRLLDGDVVSLGGAEFRLSIASDVSLERE